MSDKSFIKYGEPTDSDLLARCYLLRETVDVMRERVEIVSETSEIKSNTINVLSEHLKLVQKDLQKERNRVFVFRPRLWFKKRKKNVEN